MIKGPLARVRRAYTVFHAAVLLVALFSGAGALGAEREPLVVRTEQGDQIFLVEIADSPRERTIGLSGRYELAEDHGMLFLLGAPQEASFWMRNTHISLDIIFIDVEGKVLRIEEYTVPRSDARIPSNGLVVAVLEIGAGLSRRYGIAPGAQIVHPALPD